MISEAMLHCSTCVLQEQRAMAAYSAEGTGYSQFIVKKGA